MPELKPTKAFLQDLEQYRSNKVLMKKVVKALALLEGNPLHPGLQLERIVNDPAAWSARIDARYRLSLEPSGYRAAGNPDWSSTIVLLRLLDHDDLYKSSR